MRKNRFVMFAIDVGRFGPLVAVSIAVAVNLVNLDHVVHDQLSVLQGLERFTVALVLALAAVSAISRLLVRYAYQAYARSGDEDEEPDASAPPVRATGTRS